MQNILSAKNIKIKIYRTIILSVVFYGCENSFLSLRKNHRLTVFQNMVLRKILEPKKGYVREGYRRLHYKDDEIQQKENGKACGKYG